MKLLRGGVLGMVLFAATAVKAPCPTGEEHLGLTPTGSVTLDGFSLQRSASSGRYEADGGINFDVNVSDVTAVDTGATCTSLARTVTLRVVDPFSGQTADVQAVAP